MVNRQTREAIAKEAIYEILDKGLRDSTFCDLHPAAYADLCSYRDDMECSILVAFRRILDNE